MKRNSIWYTYFLLLFARYLLVIRYVSELIINPINKNYESMFVISHLQLVICFGTYVSHTMPEVITGINLALHVVAIESEMEYTLIGSV